MEIARLMASVILGGVLLGVSPSNAEPDVVILDQGLEIRLHDIDGSLPLESPALIKVSVRNSGSEPVRVLSDLTRAIGFRVYGSDGIELVPSFIFEHMPPPGPDLEDIAPGEERVIGMKIPLRGLGIRGPGKYTLRAEYWHRIWRGDGREHVSMRRPLLESPPITIVVRP